MMKSNLLLILNLCFPLLLWSQFSVEVLSDTNVQYGEQGTVFEMKYVLRNLTSDSIVVDWRLTHDYESTNSYWVDYTFSILVGWPESVRHSEWPLAPHDTLLVFHEILSWETADTCGLYESELLFYMVEDSAATVQSQLLRAQTGQHLSTMQAELFICGSDTLIVSDGEYIPKGIAEDESPSLRIFPNPSNGQFTLRSEALIQSITVYSMSGARVYETRPNAQIVDVTLDVPGGIYLIEVQSEAGTNVERVLVR